MNELMKKPEQSVSAQMQDNRELAEVQAKMFLSRQFPRDEELSLKRTLRDCERMELASVSQYEFPRGDSVVRGPSIRLVEVLARNWGNLSFGIREIEATGSGSTVETFAWDLETNVYDSKVFSVSNTRATKKGSYKLTDPRDVYENMANAAARRKRACILSVLPKWYVDQAVDACAETLKRNITKNGKDMSQVRNQIVAAFQKWNITPDQIKEKIGRDVDHLTENDVVRLRSLYMTINDGFAKPEDVFGGVTHQAPELPSPEEAQALADLNAKIAESADETDKG